MLSVKVENICFVLFKNKKLSGFGKVQVQTLFMAALILITVICETMGVSYYMPAAHCDLNLSTTDKGLLSGMTFLGEFLRQT